MRATELMCGDLVLHDGKPMRVYGVMERMNRVYDTMTNDISPKYLSPMPLTAEILEKNDYRKLTNGGYALRDDEKRIDITIWRSGGEPTSTMEITKNGYTEKEVTYSLQEPYSVHELQHALRLCGLNELAENIKA